MKYDRLYNFISPVTGKIANYSQFPALPEKHIIIGNENNEAIVSPILISILDDITSINYEITALEIVVAGVVSTVAGVVATVADIKDDVNTIKSNITVIFEDITDINNTINIINEGISDINIELTHIRLNEMDMRHDIDSLKKASSQDVHDAKFIIQIPDTRLPNAQALSDLDNGILGNKDGVIEILKRVSGPNSSTANNIARFDGETGQVIKDSKVKIDDDGEVYANSLHVTNSAGNNTGFKASELMLSNTIYNLPTSAGFPTQMLTTPGIPELDGSYQLYWSTPPSQITTDNPYDPSNPYPVFTPIPIPIPIPTPFPVPVFVPTPGSPLGTVTDSPVSIDPIKGDIDTPGNIDANDIHGNDASFDGDMDIDGDLSTQGDIDSLGDISAEGNVSGDAFDFEDISELSDDFVRMEAPFDLDHSYQIELPDAEPIMQEQIQPPDQRILQTAWRRVRPVTEVNSLLSKNKKVDISLPITKMSWTDIEVENPITLTFVQATSTTNEKMVIGYNGGGGQNIDIPYAVNLIYGTLNNINGSFGGFNSSAKNYSVKVKTSYHHKIDGSKSSISILNRYDNGYIFQNETGINDNSIFKLQNIEDNILTDLLEYDKNNNRFKFNTSLEVPAPTLAKHPATKEYVDSKSGSVTQITAGTGLSGGTITSTGTIAIANTGVSSGNYRFSNFTVNAQGQISNASNGSPSSTTVNTIPVWGNTSGTSLIATGVSIDSLNNINTTGSGSFSDVNIDLGGFLKFNVGSLPARAVNIRASSNTTETLLWTLPPNNSTGFLKNNGFGTMSWANTVTQITAGSGLTGGTITSTGTIAIANTSVVAGIYTNPIITIGNDGRITNAINGGSLDTGYIRFSQNLIYSTSGDIYLGESAYAITINGIVQCNRPLYLTAGATPTFVGSNQGILYVGSDKKLYYQNFNGNYYVAG